VGLHVDGRRPARTGYDVQIDGRTVGHVTSGAASPTLETNIALARLDRAPEIGDVIHVDIRGTATPATVVETPFYRRNS